MRALTFPEALQKTSRFVSSFLPSSPSLSTGSMGLVLRGKFREINPQEIAKQDLSCLSRWELNDRGDVIRVHKLRSRLERVSRNWCLIAFQSTGTRWHQTRGWQVKNKQKRGLSLKKNQGKKRTRKPDQPTNQKPQINKQTNKNGILKNLFWKLLAALPWGCWGFTWLWGENERMNTSTENKSGGG